MSNTGTSTKNDSFLAAEASPPVAFRTRGSLSKLKYQQQNAEANSSLISRSSPQLPTYSFHDILLSSRRWIYLTASFIVKDKRILKRGI
jgi:hypothetical protein